MSRYERYISSLSRALNLVGAGVLMIMMVLTVVNVLVRPVFRSILGVPEMVSYGFVVVVCFGLAYTAVMRGHVSVELVVSRFPPRVQAVIESIIYLLSIGVFAVIAWQSAVHGWEQWLVGEYAPVLKFPIMPFRYILVFGVAVLCLALLLNLFKSMAQVVGK
jgi:TRAP-type C4-dicarboxylate transport system permease small subunit